jgi:hypothetical protein
MAKGFQQKVVHRTLPFIIDTQDLGRDNPVMVSTLLFQGNPLAAEKIPYDDIITFDRLEYVLNMIMVEMADRLKSQLQQGFYDDLIDAASQAAGGEGLTATQAAEKIIIPFVRDRFGGKIAERIAQEVIAPLEGAAGAPHELFLEIAAKVVQFRIGATRIFSLMFGQESEAIVKDWLDEYTSLSPVRQAVKEADAVEAMETRVLPELESLAGRYMTYRIWSNVQEQVLPLYRGLGQGDLFLKLAEATLDQFHGFFSDREVEERLGRWHQEIYQREEAPAAEFPATDALWRIVHPDVAELLGKYIADKVILQAIDRAPPRVSGEQGKFSDLVVTLLASDLIRNMVDQHWIDLQRRTWLDRYRQLSAGSGV